MTGAVSGYGGDAVLKREVYSGSFDDTAQVWDARSGQPLGPPLSHQRSVNGAWLSRDESRILTAASNEARMWHLDADLDFPAEHFQLWIQAVTASEFDLVTRQVNPLEPNRWRDLKKRYESIAQAHAKICKYPDSNHWLRFHGK